MSVAAANAATAEPAAPKMLLRVDPIAESLSISRRTLERLIAAGRFPKPDVRVGRMGLWRPETVRAWLDGQRGRR